MHKAAVALGIIGVVCLVIAVVILLRVQERCAQTEQDAFRMADSVARALIKYEQVLSAIERRQTRLEDTFTASENLYLTIEQLKGYNHFRAPQPVFAGAKAEHVPTAQGGGD